MLSLYKKVCTINRDKIYKVNKNFTLYLKKLLFQDPITPYIWDNSIHTLQHHIYDFTKTTRRLNSSYKLPKASMHV